MEDWVKILVCDRPLNLLINFAFTNLFATLIISTKLVLCYHDKNTAFFSLASMEPELRFCNPMVEADLFVANGYNYSGPVYRRLVCLCVVLCSDLFVC
jgi:hypothetical protein